MSRVIHGIKLSGVYLAEVHYISASGSCTEGLEIKFANFLRETLLLITLESFVQTECSFRQTKHTE